MPASLQPCQFASGTGAYPMPVHLSLFWHFASHSSMVLTQEATASNGLPHFSQFASRHHPDPTNSSPCNLAVQAYSAW